MRSSLSVRPRRAIFSDHIVRGKHITHMHVPVAADIMSFSERVATNTALQKVAEELSYTEWGPGHYPTIPASFVLGAAGGNRMLSSIDGGESVRCGTLAGIESQMGDNSEVVDGQVELKIDENGDEYYERTVVVREEIPVEKIKRVSVTTVVEEVKIVPKTIEVVKIVEKPEIVFKEIPIHREVTVPEIVEQIVFREVPVPQYVEVEVIETVEKEVIVEVPRRIPRGLELISEVEIGVPRLDVEIEEVRVPIYVPEFIEVPIPIEQIDTLTHKQLLGLRREIEIAIQGFKTQSSTPCSLSEFERLGIKASLMKPKLLVDHDDLSSHWAQMCSDGCTKTRPYESVP